MLQDRLRVVPVIVMILIVITGIYSQTNRTEINVNRNGVAIEGYDPVAYHLLGRPTPGLSTISYQWMGATWLFANTSHRDRFAENPDLYAPQFGGYCSWAVSRGSTAAIDPQAWLIENSRLYLNLNPRINRRFLSNLDENILRAETNWPSIRNRLLNN